MDRKALSLGMYVCVRASNRSSFILSFNVYFLLFCLSLLFHSNLLFPLSFSCDFSQPGRNQFGQLGQPELKTYEQPTLIADLEHVNVIQAACGRNHSLFLTDTGVVYACGDNKSGQCGIGNNTTQVVQKPTRINYRGPQIIKVGCGAEFSAILDIKGNLHTFGLPEYGQLGKFDRLVYFQQI